MNRGRWSPPPQICEGLKRADPCAVVEIHRWLAGARLPRGTTLDDVEDAIDRLSLLVVDPLCRGRLAAVRDPAAFVGVLLRDARVARLRRWDRNGRALRVAACEQTGRIAPGRGDPLQVAATADDLRDVRRRIASLGARQRRVLLAVWDGEADVVRRLAVEFYGPPPTRDKAAAVRAILARARRALSAGVHGDIVAAYGAGRAHVGRARTANGSS